MAESLLNPNLRRRMRRAVARGTRLLDEQQPGWRQRIDPQALNLASPCLCVLGQLFADPNFPRSAGYTDGLTALGLYNPSLTGPLDQRGQHYGFEVPSFPASTAALGAAYDYLTGLWRKELGRAAD